MLVRMHYCYTHPETEHKQQKNLRHTAKRKNRGQFILVKDPTSLYLTCELHCEQSFLRRYQSLSSTQNSPPFMEPNASILTGHPVTNASCSQGSNVKSPVAVPPAAYSRGSGFKSWFVSRISRLRLSLFFSGPPGKF